MHIAFFPNPTSNALRCSAKSVSCSCSSMMCLFRWPAGWCRGRTQGQGGYFQQLTACTKYSAEERGWLVQGKQVHVQTMGGGPVRKQANTGGMQCLTILHLELVVALPQ